ncbi:colicin-like pore-forming protein [Enterobacter wuhouensis]|uniref:Channel forming colicins domain-containing protein n=1 Tax=Enterobacter wuhouensis TaxID=2529381 RepID=A0A4R0G758_9ENTR|nr:colicin-like pore-forming protein [Enterobacter wuhouensis]TCB91782.1 hypothetical protein E0L20_13160 [Enterobacter wuhouensis]
MAWTGFGGSWNDGVHSGGDDSGSIGGGGIKLDGKGNPTGTRAPSASDIAAQFNSFGGTQISPSQVSNIRSDGDGGFQANIAGENHGVSVNGSNLNSNVSSGFTGVSTPASNGGKGVDGGVSNWNDAASLVRKGTIPSNFKLQDGKIGIMTPVYRESGVGHGTQIEVFTGKYKFVEVPSLTKAYNEGVKERGEYAAAVKITADFYKEVGAKYGAQQAAIAKELAAAAKGNAMMDVNKAIAAFTKNQAILDANLTVSNRTAIANALAATNRAQVASNLKMFGKTFGIVGITMDVYDLTNSLVNAIKTGDWRSFFVKAGSMILAHDAGIVAAWAFSIILGTPLGILGYIVVMTAVSALVNESLVNKTIALLSK